MTDKFDLLVSPDLRNEYVDRLEVLDKVKELFLIPELYMMTTQQVADYFEVDAKTIFSCYNRNIAEITADGVIKLTPKSVSERFLQDVEIVKTQYYVDVCLPDDTTLRVPNVGINLFPKRAILRIAMLLRDSRVAKEIRTQLLNAFEHATSEQRLAEIRNEESLLLELARSYVSRDFDRFAFANQDYIAYQTRHIEELAQANETMRAPAAAYDELTNCKGWQKSEAVAKSFGMSRNELFKFLRDEGVMTKQSGYNLPYQKYVDDGCFKVREGTNKGYIYSYTVFGPKSIDLIASLRNKKGGDVS